MTRGRKAAVTALDGALATVPAAPKWLPPHAKAEWRRVLPVLVAGRKIAAHELGTVEAQRELRIGEHAVVAVRGLVGRVAPVTHGATPNAGSPGLPLPASG